MTQYYNSKRTRNLFDPASKDPFVLSRTKIDLFMRCRRCFYLDARFGVGRPPGYPMSLNNAVDLLLKKEFDIHRAAGRPHPLMETYKIAAVPLADERIEEWRDALRRGIRYHHQPTNFIVRGGIDDIWITSQKELLIVDYKATSKNEEITLDEEWKEQYKRQMEIYQWLFRQNGFKVSETGYFVYVNGRTDRKAFDGRLEFDVSIIPYKGSDKWVEIELGRIKETLIGEGLPAAGEDCDYCSYRRSVMDVLKDYTAPKKKKDSEEGGGGERRQTLF